MSAYWDQGAIMPASDPTTCALTHRRDRLTGLIPAAGALACIADWQRAAEGRGERPCVHAMLVRLDRLSSVNLAHGAAQGDDALVAAAGRMAAFAGGELGGADCLVARVAGDAFLLASNCPISRERWQWLAEALGHRLARPIDIAPPGRPVRLRPRIAMSRSIPGEVPERLLARLAETLEPHPYRPLRSPTWVDAAISPTGRGADQLEADLVAALERGDAIGAAYQPQFACEDGRIVGAEALARWRHPLLGSIGPDALFAVAERAGLAPQLSRRIMGVALADARAWPAPLRLSLNVTAADLFDRGFERQIAQALTATGFAAERLTLEITESVLVCDLERTARSLRRLTAGGTRIALDDFGAGFCNFRYLKLLPLADLKLDRSMVQGIGEDPRDLAVLRGIVAMARALDLNVTAEGIETPAQRDIVAAEGCARWQGFLGAPALSAEEFAAVVSGESHQAC